MKNILALNTANGNTSIAIKNCETDKIVTTSSIELSRQNEQLFIMIANALAQQEISYADINNIIVNVGPGSFTGVRIAVAAANGLKLAKESITMTPITGLELVAGKHIINTENNCDILALIDARRGQFYGQLFDSKLQNLTDAMLINYDKIDEYVGGTKKNTEIVMLDGSNRFDFEYKLVNCDAKDMIKIVETLFVEHKCIFTDRVEALYIRDAI